MENFHNLLFYILLYVTAILTDETKETQCYVCNSDVDINCVIQPSPDVLKSCADDTCGIIIRGTNTIRGCSSAIGNGDISALPCSENKCNGELFPITRLKCYQCQNCISVPEESLLLPCQNYVAGDECYTDVISNETIFRGCMSDKPSDLTEFVQKCNTTGCNNQETIETIKCTQCKSEEDDDCIKIDDEDTCEITTQNECVISTLLGRPNKASCFTYTKDGKVERGCIEKTSEPKPDDKYYQYCSDHDKCNRHCFRPIKCLQCSPDDQNCATAIDLETVDCPNDFVCSVCKDDKGNVIRSCGTQNQGTCAVCHNKDGCNSQKLRQCYNCTSILKENCATWKSPNRINLETCSDENEVCTTYLVNSRTIERGCKLPEAALCKDNDKTCKTCDQDKCNGESYPKGMQRCVQCSGRNCRMQIAPQVAFECDLYVPDDFCYTYVDENEVAHRGCASTANEYAQCNATGNCWICKAQACNTPKLLICYNCTSDINGTCASWKDLSEITSKMCKSPDEVCATVITGDTVERGCKLPETVECAEGDPSCQKCSGVRDNCNQGPVIKRPRRCVRCSDTAGCLYEQEQNNAVFCSKYVKDDGCYVYADKRGHVFRGCLSDEIEYQDCKDNTDNRCWACYADSCNTAKLQTCYHCSSAMNDTCASWKDPTAIKSKACQSPDEVCVTIVEGNEVERGCKLPEMVDCAEGDPSCQKCSDRDNCNEGIVTKRPKRCLQCSGNADCISQQDKSKAVFCRKYAENDGCYVYANKDGQVFRGCLSEEEEYRKCNESTRINCWTCNTDACNTEKLLQCYNCLSNIKEVCGTWMEPLTATSVVCRRPDEVCATEVTDDIVERGCKSLEKVDCAPRDPSCQKCDDDNCNKGVVTKRPRCCVRCSGINDCPKEQDKNKADFCDKYLEKDGCYVYAYKDGQVFRGCLSNVDEYQKCNDTTNNNCWTCTTDTCNTPKLFKCYSCSSDMNGTCATWTEPGAITSETCLNPDEVCTTVIKGGKIERGCKLPASCKPGDPSCQNCNDKDNCNEGPGLKRAERCVTCSGTADCIKEQDKNNSMLCEKHEENYGCFVYADKDGQAYRGCLSDEEAYRRCNDSTNNQCWTCTSDGCNTPPLRNCYLCSSDINGNCATWKNLTSIASITCRNPDEVCTAVVIGRIAKRRCLPSDRVQCLAGDPSCKKCTDWDNCNEGQLQMRPRRCLQCSLTSDCIKEQDESSAMFCDKYVENDGCFVYSNENHEVLRGCVSNTEEYSKCQKDTNGKCWTCRQDSCNNIKMPRCYTCSSNLDDNCATVKNISSIPSQVCQNPSDHCVSRLVNGTIVQRGCQPVTEIDPDCGFNSKSCKTCEGTDNCNVDPIPRKEFTCLECSGVDDCRTGESPSAKTCLTYESCYIYRNSSGKVFRGCNAAAEDFDKCVTESNWHCWTCKGDQCNTAKLRQCYTCESDISEKCATFENVNQIPQKTCHFPEEVCIAVRTGDSVQRGCELAESLSCSSGDPMCRSCINDNCNDGSLAAYPRKCVICSGTDDCTKEFTQNQTKYCDKYIKDDGCFAYTSKAGKVFRGCISNTEEYDKCQNSTGGHCKTCSEDGCNSKKLLRCLSCKSGLTRNCATLNDLLSIQSKVCQDPFEQCISQTVDKTVERGCFSESELPEYCAFNSPICKTCDKDNCNDELMPRTQIKCAQCSGSEYCQDEQDPENAATCSTYESCFVSRNTMRKTSRGCISTLEDFSNCVKAGNGFCWTCTETTCNTPKVRSCYTCESDISGNCANWTNPTLITSQTCQNPDEICATITIGKKVQRKCERPENVHCPPGDTTCQTCDDTDNCNEGLVHENPKRCHRCSGTGYCRLKQVVGTEQACEVYGQPDACYAYTDENGQVFRGCMSSHDEYENCEKAGNGKCWTCTEDGCNKDQILECFTCTTADNVNCGIWNVTNGIMSKLCQNPGEICSSHWKGEETIRDCSLSDEYCLPLNPFCYNCKEDKCNSGSIPKVQLKCHKCSNSTDCQGEQNDTSLALCYTSETNPSCWAYADINGKMIRGCTGDKAGFVNCQDSGICRTCNSEGCNEFPYLSTQSLQCYKCSDSEACGWGQRNSTISSCTNKIAYHSTPSCISRWRDNIFERGCTFDLGTCQGSKEFCEMCNTTAACNNGNIITQSCVQCKSTDDPQCAGTAQGIGGKECTATFITFNDRGCYTRIVGKDVDRGCAADLSAEDLKSCQNDKDHRYCEYCDSQDCNNKKAPSMAPAVVVLSTSALVLITIIHISI